MVGIPRCNGAQATGLFALLEQKLNAVYGNPLDPNDIEALDNSDPAIDALVKFSVWYLRDYWEIGLLPMVKNERDLDLSSRRYSERNRAEHREKLFVMVQENLERLGLDKVKDLKKARIYSRETLQDFIRARQNLLS